MAEADPSTSSRRTILATVLPALGLPSPCHTGSAEECEELIRLCRALSATQAKLDALFRICGTLAQETERAPEIARLSDHLADLAERASRLPASGCPGLLAKAKAALAYGEKNDAGQNIAFDDPGWLMLAVVEDVVAVLTAELADRAPVSA